MGNITFKMFFLLTALLGYNFAMAQTGAPHTLRGESQVASVSLNWKSPAEAKTMQWHNDTPYNGVSGVSLNGEIPVLYIANRFDKDDLKEYKGSVIDAISFCNYSAVLEVSLLLYENDKVVREQKVNIENLKLKEMQTIKLDEPYTVRDDVELTVAAKFVHGTNLTFVGIMDRVPGVTGKGDLYSYDGKNWKNVVKGNFLVSAHIDIPAAGEPDGYNVYRGDTKVNTALLTEKAAFLKDEPKGTYDYCVSAVYGDKEEKSFPLSLTNIPVEDARPIAVDVRAAVNGLNATLSWKSPILADKTLTWSNGEKGKAMGGTSGTVRKIWAVNAFSSDELASYADHKITAINVMLNSAVTEMRLVILENSKIVYSQQVSAEEIAALEVHKWAKMALTTPYVIDPSAELSYGYYVVHAADLFPGLLDSGPAISGACFISTSTAKSDFDTTVPSWTNIEAAANANWMLSADVEAQSEIKTPVVKDYTVYRDGVEVKSGITGLTYTEELAPGTYTYTVVANYADGLSSKASASATATVELPAEYVRPTFTETDFDKGKLSLKWDVYTDLPMELKHYGEPKYKWGMTNDGKDVDLYVGAQFTKEELALYADYEITGVNLYLTDDVKELKVVLCSANKKILASKTATSIKTGEMFSVALDEPVAVPVGSSIYVGYFVLFADGKEPIAADAGPRVTGGDMLSLDGTTWVAYSRIDAEFNSNFVVGAQVRLKGSQKAATTTLRKTAPVNNQMVPLESMSGRSFSDLKSATAFGVNGVVATRATDNKPTIKNFRVYCNGSLATETENPEYTATLNYGNYEYAVSAVYTNGWESALSDTYTVEYKQPNLAPAPYGLSGTLENKNLTLTWQSPEAANEMNYQDKTSGSKAIGLTRSSGVYGYFVIAYDADDLVDQVGKYITHIKYSLSDVYLQTSAIAVFYDRNLVYEQEVDVKTLVAGENVVRLDKPVVIPAGHEVCVGYYVSHINGVKPNMTDEGPAVDGKGNLITTDGTTWRTLKSMNKDLDYNWRISAVLQDADKQAVTRAEEPATTYNLYIDGTLLKEGIQATNYTVENAADGSYTVTAVVGGVETAASNAVIVGVPTSIDKVEDGSVKAYYDSQLQKVVLPEVGTAYIYSVSGTLIKQVMNVEFVDMSDLPAGVYVVRGVLTSGEQMIKVLK